MDQTRPLKLPGRLLGRAQGHGEVGAGAPTAARPAGECAGRPLHRGRPLDGSGTVMSRRAAPWFLLPAATVAGWLASLAHARRAADRRQLAAPGGLAGGDACCPTRRRDGHRGGEWPRAASRCRARPTRRGLHKEPVWLRLPIRWTGGGGPNWMLDIDYPPLNRIDAFPCARPRRAAGAPGKPAAVRPASGAEPLARAAAGLRPRSSTSSTCACRRRAR